MLSVFNSCKKDQMEVDEKLIQEFISKNKIPAVRHSEGFYYHIITPGAGNIVYTLNTVVSANYTGRLLNGSVFETSTSPIEFPLSGVIKGWELGVRLIQRGGKIRLIIPSELAYGRAGKGKIKPNTVLDFDIELVNVQN